MRRIDIEILRVSDGRMRFDVRRRQLSLHDADGRAERVLEISESALRNWLQRLLLAATPRQGLEPHETAILLLMERLAAEGAAVVATDPPPGTADETRGMVQ